MPSRHRLPDRRLHTVQTIKHWDRPYTIGVGRARERGPVLEVFINSGRSGAEVETLMRDSAVLLSLALQYGASLEALDSALTKNTDGSPMGPVGAIIKLIREGEL